MAAIADIGIIGASRLDGLGLAVDGAVLGIDHRANARAYGRDTTPRAAFEGRVKKTPSAVVDFRDRLEEYGAR